MRKFLLIIALFTTSVVCAQNNDTIKVEKVKVEKTQKKEVKLKDDKTSEEIKKEYNEWQKEIYGGVTPQMYLDMVKDFSKKEAKKK